MLWTIIITMNPGSPLLIHFSKEKNKIAHTFHFASYLLGTCVKSIHDVVWRIKTILARRSRGSRVGRALGDDPLRSADGPLFLTMKIAATDVEPTARTGAEWRIISNTVRRLCKWVCWLLAGCAAACVAWFIPLNGLMIYPIACRGNIGVGGNLHLFHLSTVQTCESAGVCIIFSSLGVEANTLM